MNCKINARLDELKTEIDRKEASFRRAMDVEDHEYAQILSEDIMALEDETDELIRKKYGA